MLLPNNNSHAKFEENWSNNAQDRSRKPIFHIHFVNKGQLLCAYLTKFAHLWSQTTPPQYQLVYMFKVWRKWDVNCSIWCTETKFQHRSRAITLSLLDEFPIYNPKPLFPNIISKTKFEENPSKNAQDREQKQSGDGWTDICARGRTLNVIFWTECIT